MNQTRDPKSSPLLRRAVIALRKRFSLREDKANDEDIDQRLREGVEMRGTKLWVLMFAIFIASIGLNVNSTAVIIGAMLISPLMGPIMGMGYGVGIDDLALVRTALKNLGIATLIGLMTSTAYFAASPLQTVQSELLARTSPTIWDVLIALFGGLAGIVAGTRREKSNVIPGVAIATALMPPLCTAGFGLATANWHFFLGAFYLFTINCVFIASASAIVIRAFHLPHKRFIDQRTTTRVHFYLGTVVLLTVLPSLYLAYQLVQEEIFKARATQFVREQLGFKQSHVVAINIEPKERVIEATLIGDLVPKEVLNGVEERLPDEGLSGAQLKVFQAGDQRIDVAALKSNLLGDVYKEIQVSHEKKDKTIEQLREEIAPLKAQQQRFKEIPAELYALYPSIGSVLLSEAPAWNAGTGWENEGTIILNVRSSKPISKADRAKIQQWLRTRLNSDAVRLSFEISKP